ncbi:MAG: FtsW/RodA/SpoVE family cell cycle protein [Phycisphaerae bacterium]
MFDAVKRYLHYTSWPIIAAMVALMAVGICAIRISENAEGVEGFASKQAMFAAVALMAFVAVTVVPYERFGRLAYLLFALAIVLLVVVLKLPDNRNVHRWINLGFAQIQVSEIAKITYIVLLAWYLRYRDNYRQLLGLAIPFILTLLPTYLVLIEPDLGTSLLFLPTLYFMLFMAGAKLRHLLVILALGAAVVLLPWPRGVDMGQFRKDRGRFAASKFGPFTFYSVDTSIDWAKRPYTPVAYCRFQVGGGAVYDLQPLSLLMMKGHQADRVVLWLRPDDPALLKNISSQVYLSKLVMGAGGLTGRGEWNQSAVFFKMLPEDHTDFIFAVIGGQWGFLGCMGVLFLYGVIFVLGVEIAAVTDDPFGRLLAVGVLALLFTQLFINAGMAMGLMPVTGMTLPLMSYGGSSLVINCVALGMLVNVGQRRPILLAPKPFEYSPKREKPEPLGVLGNVNK